MANDAEKTSKSLVEGFDTVEQIEEAYDEDVRAAEARRKSRLSDLYSRVAVANSQRPAEADGDVIHA